MSIGKIAQKSALNHAQVIRELIARDKNRPSIILWSIANEPDSVHEVAYEYFEPLAKLARSLAPSRPVCYVNDANGSAETEKLAGLFGVVCLNRYFGWYTETFDLALATAICLYHALPSESLLLHSACTSTSTLKSLSSMDQSCLSSSTRSLPSITFRIITAPAPVPLFSNH